ncbi:response regulator [Pseudoflavitalea sp. X16]|uniref:hybrid sensor histidine kinase/response regulator n=1 Tax=Paraflavitalea devenefica TaxID=2716334 RepID=UPI00141EAD70|nr:hybrid sensor histidine kinase/response regulator [Paraflavitalea devenefica]NII26221.1 response regulator [Paraflavitalea devenefica]
MCLPSLRQNKWIYYLIGLGATSLDLEQNKKIRIVNGVSIITGMMALVVGSFFSLLSHDTSIGVPALIEGCLFAVVVYLNYRKQYLAAALLGHVIQNLAVIYFGALLGSIVDAQFMAVFLVGIPLLIFNNWPFRLICIAATFVTMLTLELNSYYGFIAPIEINPKLHLLFQLVSAGAILFLNVIVIFLYDYNNKLLVKQLEVSNNNLQRVSKFKTIHVREINHELKGPMNAIHSISQVLLDQNDLDEKGRGVVYKHLHAASQHAVEITNNVLELSAIEEGIIPPLNNGPVYIESLVKETCQWYQPMADKKSINILFRMVGNVPVCLYADKTKLRQIVSNLLVNAIKFSPANEPIFVTINVDEDFLHIRVRDKGPGIGPEKLADLFKEFVTESNDLIPGTGLGLHISQNLADRMGGTIDVKSMPGKGSAFILRTPCIPVDENKTFEDSETTNGVKAPPSELHKSVYILEDNAMHALYLKRYLTKWGCTFKESELALPGIQEIISMQPEIILLDGQLPDGNAVEILDRIRAIPEINHIPVIVITGESYQDEIRSIEKAGAVHIIKKPLNYSELHTAISEHALDLYVSL